MADRLNKITDIFSKELAAPLWLKKNAGVVILSMARVTDAMTAQYFKSSSLIIIISWFFYLSILNISSYTEPPVWDSAMSVFPAAIFLADSGFDIVRLFAQESWLAGGPNVHSRSMMTWILAALYVAELPQYAMFFVVHTSMFLLASTTAMVFVKQLRVFNVSDTNALLAGTLLFSIPLVVVQVGYMYTELPVLACGVFAWYCWANEKEFSALGFAVVAVLFKFTGMIILSCVLLLIAKRITQRDCGLMLAVLGFFSLLVALVHYFLPVLLVGESAAIKNWGSFEYLFRIFRSRLGYVYDVRLILVIGALATFTLLFFKLFAPNRLSLIKLTTRQQEAALLALTVPFVFFFGLVYQTYQNALFLPRYLLPIIPFAIFQIAYIGTRLKCSRWIMVAFLLLLLFSLSNSHGRFYSKSNSFSLIESSMKYKEFLSAQRTAIRKMETLDPLLPKYVSREIYYMVSSPKMGYVSDELPLVRGAFLPNMLPRDSTELDCSFYLVFTNTKHGSRRMRRVLKNMYGNSDWLVRKKFEYSNEEFPAEVFRIDHKQPITNQACKPV